MHLSLSNNITYDGAKFVGELLKRNKTLKILDLSANRIEDPGAIYLSEALETRNMTLLAWVFAQLPQRLQGRNLDFTMAEMASQFCVFMLIRVGKSGSSKCLDNFSFLGEKKPMRDWVGFLYWASVSAAMWDAPRFVRHPEVLEVSPRSAQSSHSFHSHS